MNEAGRSFLKEAPLTAADEKAQTRLSTGRRPKGGDPSTLGFGGESPLDWPLVGRGTECALLCEAMTAGRWASAVLAGEAGVGKTRLALDVLQYAERGAYSTIWVGATRSAASIPFAPFAHLLSELPRGSVSRLDLLHQLVEKLTAQAQDSRLVIGVDDAHLLDDASAALVHQLALSHRAFVLVTLRTGEPAPDSVLALWKDGLATRLELGALSEDEVRELVPAALRGHVDQPTIARLWGATRGNVLFLRELVLAGLNAGALRESGGVWSWHGPMTVSQRLNEVIDARLGTLGHDLMALMEVLAYGEPVSAHALEGLSFSPATLETAERRGIVTATADGRLKL